MRPSPVIGPVGIDADTRGPVRQVGELGQTEIEHLDATFVLAVTDHDVGRLQIAVRDALLVSRGQRVRYGNGHSQQSIGREAPGGHRLGKRSPLDQLHREKDQPVGLFHGVDRDNVRVIQCGDCLSFALEADTALGVERARARQNFGGNQPVQPRISRAIHLAHAASAKQRNDFVPAETSPWFYRQRSFGWNYTHQVFDGRQNRRTPDTLTVLSLRMEESSQALLRQRSVFAHAGGVVASRHDRVVRPPRASRLERRGLAPLLRGPARLHGPLALRGRDGRTHVAQVDRQSCALILSDQWPEKVGKGLMFISLNVEPATHEAEVAAVDALRAELGARGVAVKDGHWGYRVLVVEDPDGNQLFFPYPNEPQNPPALALPAPAARQL